MNPYKKELSTLLRETTWSNNLHIMSKTKTDEEKIFYLKLAGKEKYSARELERQIDSGYYERLVLSEGKASSALLNTDVLMFLSWLLPFLWLHPMRQHF